MANRTEKMSIIVAPFSVSVFQNIPTNAFYLRHMYHSNNNFPLKRRDISPGIPSLIRLSILNVFNYITNINAHATLNVCDGVCFDRNYLDVNTLLKYAFYY